MRGLRSIIGMDLSMILGYAPAEANESALTRPLFSLFLPTLAGTTEGRMP